MHHLRNQRFLSFGVVQKEADVRYDHHATLTPAQHDVGATLVLEETRAHGANERDDDIVGFVSCNLIINQLEKTSALRK